MLRRLFRHERRQEDEPHNHRDQRRGLLGRRSSFFRRFRSSSSSSTSSLVRAVPVGGGGDFAGSDVSIDDLIEPLRRRRNRLRRVGPHINFVRRTCRRSNLTYSEWQLRVNCRQLLKLLRLAPKVADLLLDFLLGPLDHCQVVWLSDSHFLLCGDCVAPAYSLKNAFWMFLNLECRDSRGQAVLLFSGLEADLDQDGAEILRTFHKAVALGTQISMVSANLGIIPPQVVEAMVAQAQSPRTVCVRVFDQSVREHRAVPNEVGRILALSCGDGIELVANLDKWEDRGVALAAAMRANRCPKRLVLYGLDDFEVSNIIAPALESTDRIESFGIHLRSWTPFDSLLSAIGRNQGIRTLVLVPFLSSPLFIMHVKSVWKAISASPSIRYVVFAVDMDVSIDWDRRACAEAVAELVQSNRFFPIIQYDDRILDEEIMESRVMPVVCINRLQADLEDVWESQGGRGERVASLLLGAPLVRHHHELLYVVLKSCREHLCLPGGNGQHGDDVPH